MIYLASPYSHPIVEVKVARYQAALDFCARHIPLGHVIFSPIVHCHPMAVKHGMPGNYEAWIAYDKAMIIRAHSFWVLQLDGWEQSRGVTWELGLARTQFPPQRLRFIHPATYHDSPTPWPTKTTLSKHGLT